MIKGISLTASMRSNLLSLSNISTQMDKTQNILSTGKKVNSAIDNASSYYQARSLTNRASDLSSLLDAMGQGIQTIQAASEGLESATSYLEQMKSVAEQALALPDNSNTTNAPQKVPMQSKVELVDNSAELIAQGYTAVSNETEFMSAIQNGSKIVLTNDLELEGISILGNDNLIINGGGHTLTLNDGFTEIISNTTFENINIETEIELWSEKKDITFRNVNIDCNNNNVYSIVSVSEGKLTLENVNINVTANHDITCVSAYYSDSTIKNLTINITSTNADAKVTCVDLNYVDSLNIDGIGIITDNKNTIGIISSTVIDELDEYTQPSHENGIDRFIVSVEDINKVYAQVEGDATNPDTPTVPDEPEAPTGPQLVTKDLSWYIDNGYTVLTKDNINSSDGKIFRGNDKFVLAEDVEYIEQYITDYEDSIIIDGNGHTMTFYDPNVESAGIVICNNVEMKNIRLEFNAPEHYKELGVTQASVIAVGYESSLTLSNAELVNTMSEGGIGIEVRYGGTLNIDDTVSINASTPIIGGIVNDSSAPVTTFALRRSAPAQDNTSDGAATATYSLRRSAPTQEPMAIDEPVEINATYADYIKQYDQLINEFNNLLADASYQGVNLLTGGNLNVTFNESRTHSMTVNGKDMRTDNIGLNMKNWSSKADIETAIKQIVNAMNEVRSFSADLGNKYTIIQTRQNFTEALTDVLETGADDLVLADMNEASAEYLMLQTRQQLAVNSLSLASQSASSILSLF